MVEKSRRLVDQFIADLDAREIMITGDIGTKALDAAQSHGKIINHRAKLNMGDCFTYACARAYRTKIAFKGDDFTHTDLGW
jgi:ribonuclease VapC